jgi:hypothetical protein
LTDVEAEPLSGQDQRGVGGRGFCNIAADSDEVRSFDESTEHRVSTTAYPARKAGDETAADAVRGAGDERDVHSTR